MLRTALMICGVVLASLIAVYLFSFVLFTLHKSGLWFAPQFGHRGLMLLVVGSPWLILSLLGIFLLILYMLVSHYSFSYRKPLVYSMIGVVFAVVLMSSVIQYFGIHERMQSFIEKHDIQRLAPLYRNQSDHRPPGVIEGTIVMVSESLFMVTTDHGESITVHTNAQTRMPQGTALLVGDKILIFGTKKGADVDAFGIRPFSGEQLDRPQLRKQDQKILR